VNEYTSRFNDLAIESAQSVVDSAYLAQRQNAEFLQSWLQALEANQQRTRELAGKLIGQMQEGQSLWLQFSQELFRNNLEAFTKAAQAQAEEAAERLNGFQQQARKTADTVQSAANKVAAAAK
jgi:hypothetical protein